MCNGDEPRMSGPSASIANWRQPMPFGRKLRLFIRNNWLKVRRRQTCCGNYGEPGC